MTLPVGPRAVAPDVYQAIQDSIAPNASRLKASYNGYLARALAVAVAVHLLGIGAYWLASSMAVPDFGPAGKRITSVAYVPPPINAPDTPPGGGASPERPGSIVTPVPEEDADPEVVVAENDEVTPNPGDEVSPGGPAGPRSGPGGEPEGRGGRNEPAEPFIPEVRTGAPPVPERVVEPPVRDFAEIQPGLIGGIERLQEGIEYPHFERAAGVDGRVVVQFVVDEAGVPSQIVAVRSVSPGLDAAAMQAVREARFTPGRQNGQAVRVRFTLPVTFRLR